MKNIPAAFFEVSPFWAKVMSEAKTIRDIEGHLDDNGKERSISDPQHCIVGEAYHDAFKVREGDYGGCKECHDFSWRFGQIMHGEHDGRGNRKQQMLQNVKDFTDHWRAEHNPLLEMDTDTEPITVRP
jgi:hypothetical protein